jgi:uncharacterized protein
MEYLLGMMLLIIIVASILIYHMFQEAHADRTLTHDLDFKEFPVDFGELSIFFISDIHRRKVSDTIIKNAQGKADIVIIGGDLAEKGVRLNQIKENLERLKQIAPVYFVWGNNDYEINTFELREMMSKLEVNVLENSAVYLKGQKRSLVALVGVDDTTVGESDIERAVSYSVDSQFRILVSHNPDIIDLITPEHQIQFILSGHTHGGQIRIFGFGPYENGGIKRVGNTLLFISNGYGTTTLPLRLGAKAETHLIRITNSRSQVNDEVGD